MSALPTVSIATRIQPQMPATFNEFFPALSSAPTAVDLFSGCGGLSLGLMRAGFSVMAGVEIDPKALETYRLNHPHTTLYGQDIRTLDPAAVLQDIGLKPGELDLLAGCPPCQGFSRLRTKNRKNAVEDERNDLVGDFMRFVHAMKPKCIMLENVPALAQDERFTRMRKDLEELKYKLAVHVLDAADYSVPQRRRRLIMLASRVHDPVIAEATPPKVTVRDVLAAMEAPSKSKDKLHAMPERRSETVKSLIKRIPKDGGSRNDLGADLQLPCHKKLAGFHDVYGRMSWDDVSPTITSGCHAPSKGRFLHPSRNRTITLREAALLQGFPLEYRFNVTHGKEAIALMIGNALPPPFIAAHAIALLRGLHAATHDGKSLRR